MYLVAECRERGNVYDYVVREIHRVRLHFQLMYNLNEIRTGLYRHRDADELKRNMNLDFLALSDCIKVYVTREIREWVQVNFVNKRREGRSRPAETRERHDSSLASLPQN